MGTCGSHKLIKTLQKNPKQSRVFTISGEVDLKSFWKKEIRFTTNILSNFSPAPFPPAPRKKKTEEVYILLFAKAYSVV